MTPGPGLLLVEDDPHFRRAVEALLAASFTVHATALARAGLAWVENGVAFAAGVVDLGLPDADGVDLIRALRAARPTLPVIALTISDTRERVLAALDAGAQGYVLKDHVVRELVPAIEAALAGEARLSSRAAKHVVEALRAPAPAGDAKPPLLTTMERRVLDELARGRSYAQIGLVLDISVNTVRSRIRTLFAKLDVASSTEAIHVASRLGLLHLRD